MATTTKQPTEAVAKKLSAWNKKLKVEVTDNATVTASAKSIDVTADDLSALTGIIGDDWTISFGRSGANFRMILW